MNLKEGTKTQSAKPTFLSEVVSIFEKDSIEIMTKIKNLEEKKINISACVNGLTEFLGFIPSANVNNASRSDKVKSEQSSKCVKYSLGYMIVPKASFYVYKTDLELDCKAREALLKVNDTDSAIEFMNMFGMYCRVGTYDIGGVLSGIFVDSTNHNHEFTQSQKATARSGVLNTVFGVLFNANGTGDRESGNGSSKEDLSINALTTQKIIHIGPIVNDPKIFAEKLNDFNECDIIKSPCDPCDYIPIWDIVKDKKLKKAVELIKNVYDSKYC